MKLKSFLALILAIVSLAVFTSCNKGNENLEAISNTSSSVTDTASGSSEPSAEDTSSGGGVKVTNSTGEVIQLDAPEVGEEIVVMTTSKGVMKFRMFADQAPLAVENFLGLINNGYYDGVTFHRIVKDFVIQGGDPTGTGTGGESIWGGGFEIELAPDLYHFRGALAMANTAAADSNTSQFYVVQAPSATQELFDSMGEQGYPVEDIPQTIIDQYLETGGVPYLDFNNYSAEFMSTNGLIGYTVFGQLFEGYDVLDAIAAVEIGEDGETPAEEVTIDAVEIVKYEG